jgi:hypothetical protein
MLYAATCRQDKFSKAKFIENFASIAGLCSMATQEYENG